MIKSDTDIEDITIECPKCSNSRWANSSNKPGSVSVFNLNCMKCGRQFRLMCNDLKLVEFKLNEKQDT